MSIDSLHTLTKTVASWFSGNSPNKSPLSLERNRLLNVDDGFDLRTTSSLHDDTASIPSYYWQHQIMYKDSNFEVLGPTEKEYFVSSATALDFVPPKASNSQQSWRTKKGKRTVSVALLACLNIGVEPPDANKPTPCAKLQCWTDPESMPKKKALQTIGAKLQRQYEVWQPRIRYKTLMDPCDEEVRKLCTSLRRVSPQDRILLHYNGHGVPRPTENGEIWVFNKGLTQYIPLSLFELQSWLRPDSPAMFVFDCNHAGLIVQTYQNFLRQGRHTNLSENSVDSETTDSCNSISGLSGKEDPMAILEDECMHMMMASCGATQSLPTNPAYPADLFTACLTTPVKAALVWFINRTKLTHAKKISIEEINKLPGMNQPSNRKSPYGELNWIFTAITDSIAWSMLPRALFLKLFRQDMLVASMFRNFLLAQRTMHSLNCTVVSCPSLPLTHRHSMWEAWDFAMDVCLSQLQRYLKHGTAFQASKFFEQQLTGFEVWLEFASEDKPPPPQLPVVLQVVLSQAHRLRALQLLSRFMDRGGWAVDLGLDVGIFPYVQKLLTSPAAELREVLVCIWSKILCHKPGCRKDLQKSGYLSYFIKHIIRQSRLLPLTSAFTSLAYRAAAVDRKSVV